MKSHFVVFWMWLLLWHQMMWMWSHMINFKTMMLIIYRWEVRGCKKLFTFFIFSSLFGNEKKNQFSSSHSHSQLDVPFIHSIYLHLSIVAKVLVLSSQNERKILYFLMSCLILMAMMKMAKKNSKKKLKERQKQHRKLSMKDEIFFFFFFNSFPFFIFPINTKIERTWLLRYWWFSIFFCFFLMMKKNFFISIFSAFLIEKMRRWGRVWGTNGSVKSVG